MDAPAGTSMTSPGVTSLAPSVMAANAPAPFVCFLTPLSCTSTTKPLPAGTGGANLGWNVMEGDVCYGASDCDTDGLTRPVATIAHADGACSVIGGHVYRGSAIPELAGGYVYTDLCIGTLWVLDAAAALADGTADPVAVGQGSAQMVSFGEGDDGELFVVDQGGAIMRLVADADAAR